MAAGMDGGHMTSVTVLRSTVAEKNKVSILEQLKKIIPDGSHVLEIASGTGQHVTFFSEHLPQVTWYPSECNDMYLASIQGYMQITHRSNVKEAVWLDTRDDPADWGKGQYAGECHFDFLLCINMLHFCEWNACKGLFRGTKYHLKPGGFLLIYGPFVVQGETCPEENTQFDCMLRQHVPKMFEGTLMNSEWGLRETFHLDKLAELNGLKKCQIISITSNQKLLLFEKPM